MRPSDSREGALVAEEGVELAALATQDLGERGCVEVERIRAEVCEILSSCSGVVSQTPARFFFPPSVRISSPPFENRSRNIGFFGPFAPGCR